MEFYNGLTIEDLISVAKFFKFKYLMLLDE